jgi:hypothetical protein
VWTEICAYGTAVQAVPVTDAAKYTAQQLGYGAAGSTVRLGSHPKEHVIDGRRNPGENPERSRHCAQSDPTPAVDLKLGRQIPERK